MAEARTGLSIRLAVHSSAVGELCSTAEAAVVPMQGGRYVSAYKHNEPGLNWEELEQKQENRPQIKLLLCRCKLEESFKHDSTQNKVVICIETSSHQASSSQKKTLSAGKMLVCEWMQLCP